MYLSIKAVALWIGLIYLLKFSQIKTHPRILAITTQAQLISVLASVASIKLSAENDVGLPELRKIKFFDKSTLTWTIFWYDYDRQLA